MTGSCGVRGGVFGAFPSGVFGVLGGGVGVFTLFSIGTSAGLGFGVLSDFASFFLCVS